MPDKKTASILVLLKAMSVLKCFQTSGSELNIPQISSMLDIPKPTVHRILVTLERGRFVEKNPATEAYRLGIGILELSMNFLNNMDIRTKAMPLMERLAKETGENVYLAVYDHGDTVNIHQEQGQALLSGNNRIGLRIPAHLSALGKVILAYTDQQKVNEYLSSVEFKEITPNTITSASLLLKELLQVKENGFAIDNEEYEVGLKCIAAPIFNLRGQVEAAISISGAANRVSDDVLPVLGNKLKEATKEISEHLGYFQ